jgi:hypothetical protein
MYDSRLMADDERDSIGFGPPPGSPQRDEPAWDADDPRRQHDQFAPPKDPCECYCLHCNRVFMSDQIWFQRVIGDKNGFEGFWMCPTPNCGGAGFTFDIFPTDPNHPANAGWCDDEDEEYYEEEFTDPALLEIDTETPEWDPDEPLYKSFDDHDDDIEGEEWKYGLEPGEQLPQAQWSSGHREMDEEERRYNEPDERPRELDWSNRDEREGPITEDDIPF